MHLFQLGEFVAHGGQTLTYKVECDVLTNDDWQTLARLAHPHLRPFRRVEGVPTGGLRLAHYLRPYAVMDGGLLIVDDVLTTGGSMEFQRSGRIAQGLVIFARGPYASWIKAMWTWGLT